MMRKAALVFCILVCFTAVLPGSAQGNTTTPSEEAAIQAFRQGSFSKAVDLYRQGLQETDDPGHRARLHINIAWTLFALGRESEVQTHLRAALVEDPNLTLLPDYYTQEFIDLFDQARMRGVAVDSSTPPPDLEVTIAAIEARMLERRDLEGALADVDRLLAAYPEDGRLIPLRAEILRDLGLETEADDLLRTYGGDFTAPGPMATACPFRTSFSAPTACSRRATAARVSICCARPSPVNRTTSPRSNSWPRRPNVAVTGMKPSSPSNQPSACNPTTSASSSGSVRFSSPNPTFPRPATSFERSPNGRPIPIEVGRRSAFSRPVSGNRDRALSHLDRAIEENPLLPEVQLARGELLLAIGVAEAGTRCSRVRREPPPR